MCWPRRTCRAHLALDVISVPPLATRFLPMQTDEIVHKCQAVAIVLAESLEAAEAGAAAVRVSYRQHRLPWLNTSTVDQAFSCGGYNKR